MLVCVWPSEHRILPQSSPIQTTTTAILFLFTNFNFFICYAVKSVQPTAPEDSSLAKTTVTELFLKPTPSSTDLLGQPSSLSPSPSSSDSSLPSPIFPPATEKGKEGSSTERTPTSPSHKGRAERLPSSSSGHDALKKTIKDLQRSSVSLPRFQLLLEEVNYESVLTVYYTFCVYCSYGAQRHYATMLILSN